ncbi:ThrRS/AlaRS common domain-containing protein [Xylona heveae TC161]|uniref:ThrRS/AlaRS common domain-containing protein n=1 Tax=Xylona heveae (strain CBS 132557 / TC161) TaxID=1328760 RepID=A0A165I9Q5_XYLHT|nr:ThrRS/AlaRS common domain-containing protein [Xylona heveae TC161]KZF24591.1 ThrRS/AlaRS common domain-containing protein [Xylona heveae TC161]
MSISTIARGTGTVPVYQTQASLHELVTRIVSCQLIHSLPEADRGLFKGAIDSGSEEDDYVIATEETIFHPQGGGQPSDIGYMKPAVPTSQLESLDEMRTPEQHGQDQANTLERKYQEDPHRQDEKAENNKQGSSIFNVKLVRKSTTAPQIIYHFGRFSSSSQDAKGGRPNDQGPPNEQVQPTWQKGASVMQTIDSATRNYHSRYHTGGHILGLAVRQLQDQIGQPVSEIKANHAPGMAFVEFRGLIAGEHKAAIQERVSELVQRSLAVNVELWDEEQAKARCAALPEGFKLPIDGDGKVQVRVVDVDGVGAYPCGGTHLPTTRDIGGVVVRKISRSKGVSKVSYEITDV